MRRAPLLAQRHAGTWQVNLAVSAHFARHTLEQLARRGCCDRVAARRLRSVHLRPNQSRWQAKASSNLESPEAVKTIPVKHLMLPPYPSVKFKCQNAHK